MLARLQILTLGFLVTVAIGCGGGGPSSTAGTSPALQTPVTTSSHPPANVNAVAFVGGTAIPKASYSHWLSVEKALGSSSGSKAGHMALGFLLTSEWVLGEAAARHLTVSDAQLKQYLDGREHQHFPKAGSLHEFLARAHETEDDLLVRAKIELLESSIATAVAKKTTGAQKTALLDRFEQAFKEHWRGFTKCNPGYVMEDCSEYKGKGEGLTAPTQSDQSRASISPSTSSSSGHRRSSTPSSGRLQAEIPPPRAGSLTLTSSAFTLNGGLPQQYTCDGTDTSPPLEWHNVPAKAAALVLFIIEDTPTFGTPGPSGGIRWIVANIDPKSSGVAAGQVPRGGVVGADTQGHTGYGGICPEHGATGRIEFLLYALSKNIQVSPGFQPSAAEHEYGTNNLVLGEPAVTYALYARP